MTYKNGSRPERGHLEAVDGNNGVVTQSVGFTTSIVPRATWWSMSLNLTMGGGYPSLIGGTNVWYAQNLTPKSGLDERMKKGQTERIRTSHARGYVRVVRQHAPSS